MEFFNAANADAFCVQETKLQKGQIDLNIEGYSQYWNYAEKKGYSGTAIFTKMQPLSVAYNIGHDIFDKEGRLINLEFRDYYLVNIYSPNSQRGLTRLDDRMSWENCLFDYLKNLELNKPVVLCGDLNVAHKEIDLKNPSSNKKNAGFTEEERSKFSDLLQAGFIDTFRQFHPEEKDAYTWWSYMFNAREKNAGWRIDYFCASASLAKRLIGAEIYPEVMGSDHCPISLIIE